MNLLRNSNPSYIDALLNEIERTDPYTAARYSRELLKITRDKRQAKTFEIPKVPVIAAQYSTTTVWQGARDIAEALEKMHKLNFPIPIGEGLVPVIERMLTGNDSTRPFRIELSAQNLGANQVHSLLLRYSDHAIVVYSRNLNLCWRRFEVAKQLAYLAFSILPDEGKKPASSAENSAELADVETPIEKPEAIATFAAVELLIPWKLRPQLEKMRSDGKTAWEIAMLCRVPVEVVNSVFFSSAVGKRVSPPESREKS